MFCADFHQLKPINGYALHSSLVTEAVPPDKLKSIGVTPTKQSENGADRKGTTLLKGFKRLYLTDQMRAAEDDAHRSFLEEMRDVNSSQPVSDAFINSLQQLTSKAIEDQGDALRFAKIGVLSNMERHRLNYVQARVWAKKHGIPLFWWRQELTGVAASWLSEEEQNRLYDVEREGLCMFFCQGAPASITYNIETGRGLVNGCDASMHSLTMPDDFDMDVFRLSNFCRQGDEALEIELPCSPISVNAIPDVSKEAKQILLAHAATLDTKNTILSVPMSSLSDNEHALLDGVARAEKDMVKVRTMDISESLVAALLKKGATIDGNLIVPVLVGNTSVKFNPCSVWAAQMGIPKNLQVKKHQIDLAFAVTDYKVQGKTLEHFIISIGPRNGIMPALTLTDLYVLVSRVRSGNRLYVIGFDPAVQSDHLRKLKPSSMLAIWEAGYHDSCDSNAGFWCENLAKKCVDRLAIQIEERRKTQRQKRYNKWQKNNT